MPEFIFQLLIFAYAFAGIISTIGYIPTIKDLWFHKKMSANISSYVIWTVCASATFLYSIFILPDLLFRIVSGLNFMSCAAILVLSIFLNKDGSAYKKTKAVNKKPGKKALTAKVERKS